MHYDKHLLVPLYMCLYVYLSDNLLLDTFGSYSFVDLFLSIDAAGNYCSIHFDPSLGLST